ncbi:MAG: hypothetical protein V4473_01800 [Patescibacteria group bacterium]
MEFFTKNKKVIIGIIILIGLIYFGYATVFSTSSSDIAEGDTPAVLQDSGPAKEILNAVDKFKNVSIDPEIFTSDLFKNLKDFTSIVTPEQRGRSNPFAVFGAINSTTGAENTPFQTTPVQSTTRSTRNI